MKIISNHVVRDLLSEDKKIFVYISGYAILISILYLALPLSTQLIINRIKQTALIQPVLIISIILISLLSLAGILNVLQKYLLEMYKRQSFVRITSKLFLKTIYATKRNLINELTNDLSSKYFEIFNIQNNMSILVIEGLLVILQIIVGFMISSFYHPYILVINIITSVIIYITWKIFFGKAVSSSIQRSEKKYLVYSWFDNLLNNSNELKNNQFREYAVSKSQNLVSEYIMARVNYWKIIFSQTIIFVFLSSAVILSIFSIGSFLVMSGQLTLGQLVASEIIFISSIFSIGKLASFFDRYYELTASIDKINYLLSLEENEFTQSKKEINHNHIIDYDNVEVYLNKNDTALFNLRLQFKNVQQIQVKNEEEANLLIDLVKYSRYIANQTIQINQLEHLDYEVIAIENLQLISEPLICYLTSLTHPTLQDHSQVSKLLEKLSLQQIINNLDNGIDSVIMNKYQLSNRVIILLKLIRAILSKSEIICIGGLVNLLENKDLDNITLLCSEYNKYLVLINYK